MKILSMKHWRQLYWLSLLACFAIVFLFVATSGSPSSEMPASQEKHPEADFSISCLECHQEVTPEIASQWYEGKHGQVNIGCFICHGDGEVEFHAKPSDSSCISCHSGKAVDFASIEATSCFSCHGGHSLRFHEN